MPTRSELYGQGRVHFLPLDLPQKRHIEENPVVELFQCFLLRLVGWVPECLLFWEKPEQLRDCFANVLPSDSSSSFGLYQFASLFFFSCFSKGAGKDS